MFQKNAKIDGLDKGSRTPLMLAAQDDRVDVIELLLDEGAKIEAKDKWGVTPIVSAVRSGKLGAMKLLLDRKGISSKLHKNVSKCSKYKKN
jgi:ankyrin repeat protein